MNEHHDPMTSADSESDRLLRDNLRVPALSPEALARIRLATEAEWRANVRQSAPRRWMPLAAAASLALLTATALWTFQLANAPAGEPLATLVRAPTPGTVELRPLWREAPVAVGATIHAGREFAARGGALLTLEGGGNLRLAPGSEVEVLSASSLRLRHGELYVDIPPGAQADARFVAVTARARARR